MNGLEYAPLFGVEIVGTVAYVFYPTQRQMTVGDHYVSLGEAVEICGVEGFFMKIAESFSEGDVYGGECFGGRAAPHRQRM